MLRWGIITEMAIYIFMLIGVIALGIPLCGKRFGKTGKIVYCIIAAAAFIFISSARFEVGYDYNLYGGTYAKMKYCFPEDLLQDRMEKGFIFPFYILSLAFDSYVTAFIYTSIVIYASTFYLVYKYSSSPWISLSAYLCFGLFFNSLCFLRQMIAAIIVLYAMKFIDKKNPAKFFILVLAASAFHWSVLIMLVMFFFLKIKPGYIYLGIVTVGTIIFCIFSKSLMFWAIDHFAMYSGYNPETNPEASNGLPMLETVPYVIFFIICFVFRKKLIAKNPKNSIYINCLMYTVVFVVMGTRHGILSRFAIVVYMTPFLYLLPDLVSVVNEFIKEKFSGKEQLAKTLKIGSVAASALFSVGYYVIMMAGDNNGVVPYISQFNRPYDIFVEQVIEDEDYVPGWFEYDEEDEDEYDDEYDEYYDDYEIVYEEG